MHIINRFYKSLMISEEIKKKIKITCMYYIFIGNKTWYNITIISHTLTWYTRVTCTRPVSTCNTIYVYRYKIYVIIIISITCYRHRLWREAARQPATAGALLMQQTHAVDRNANREKTSCSVWRRNNLKFFFLPFFWCVCLFFFQVYYTIKKTSSPG